LAVQLVELVMGDERAASDEDEQQQQVGRAHALV